MLMLNNSTTVELKCRTTEAVKLIVQENMTSKILMETLITIFEYN